MIIRSNRILYFFGIATACGLSILTSCTEKISRAEKVTAFGTVISAELHQGDNQKKYIKNVIQLIDNLSVESDTRETNVIVCTNKSLRVGEKVLLLLHELSRDKAVCDGFNVTESHGNKNIVIESVLLPRGVYFYSVSDTFFLDYNCPRKELVVLDSSQYEINISEIEKELNYLTKNYDSYLPETVLKSCLRIER